jgi:hypothetical protein
MRRTLALLVAATVLAGCGVTTDTDAATTTTASSTTTPVEQTILGFLLLRDLVRFEPCVGTGGYGDIHDGAQVVVKDDTGATIAVGELGPGELYAVPSGGDPEPGQPGYCRFDLTVLNVPDSDFYEIAVGTREGITYSREEMEDASWELELSLG